jgi:hypothetical protein
MRIGIVENFVRNGSEDVNGGINVFVVGGAGSIAVCQDRVGDSVRDRVENTAIINYLFRDFRKEIS